MPSSAPCKLRLCFAYFAVLLLLAMYGLHRSHLVLTCLRYAKKLRALREGAPRLAARSRIRDAAARDDPAAALQRGDRRARLLEQTARMDVPARQARDPGPRRLDRRDRQMARAKVMSFARAAALADGARADWDGGSTSSTSTASTAPATRPARSTRGSRSPRASSSPSSTPTSSRSPTSSARSSPHFARSREGRHGAGALGPHEPRHLAAHAVQALMLDGHHLVENRARSAAGWLFNFSGTGGMWRKEAIARRGRLAARHAHRGSRSLATARSSPAGSSSTARTSSRPPSSPRTSAPSARSSSAGPRAPCRRRAS